MIIEIRKEGRLYGKVIRHDVFPRDLQFYSDDSDFIQVGTWQYNSGRHLGAHAHREFDREITRTQEVIVVMAGLLKVNFFDHEGNYFQSEELSSGNILIVLDGGHSYDILDDDTRVVEVKNGPYFGVEKDKIVLEESE